MSLVNFMFNLYFDRPVMQTAMYLLSKPNSESPYPTYYQSITALQPSPKSPTSPSADSGTRAE